MLGWSQIENLLGAVVGVGFVLFLAVAGWGSPQTSDKSESPTSQNQSGPEQRGTDQAPIVIKIQQPQQAQNKPESNATERPKEGSNSWFSGWNLSDRIAAIASVAAFLQFVALIITIMVMVRNGRRQLRAYVFPEEIGLIDGTMMNPPMPVHTNEPGVVLLFRNSGQTPAYRVVSWAMIAVTEPVNENVLVAPEKLLNVFSGSIGANGGKMPKAIWFGRPLTAAEITDVGNRTKCIYVYGRVEYDDAFGRRWPTTFRLAYAGAFPPAPGVGLSFTQEGNDAK